jgi:molybdopterin-guanine dinucleotide biosynthesis protein A
MKPGGELLGLILCGGESRRMGRDKGLITKDGVPWALYVGRKLEPRMPVYYSIRQTQQEAYATVLPAERMVPDALDIPGPLNGLLSVHRRFPASDILLVACDMLDLDEKTIATLLDAYEKDDDGHDFYVYGQMISGRFFAQPFCAIYTAAGLTAVAEAYLENVVDDLSLQALLRRGRILRLPMDGLTPFNNYNTLG